jgi:hypothetical protein
MELKTVIIYEAKSSNYDEPGCINKVSIADGKMNCEKLLSYAGLCVEEEAI